MLIHGKSSQVLLGNALKAYDVTGWLNKITPTGDVTADETTVFGLDSKRYMTGLIEGKMAAEGIFEHIPGAPPTAIDHFMFQATGGFFGKDRNDADGDATMVWLPAGGNGALADRAIAQKGIVTNYEPDSPVDGIISMKLEVMGDAGLDTGAVLFPLANRSGSVNGSSIDDGATALANSVAVAVFYVCTVHAGGASVTYKLQDSADNSTFADIAGATFSFSDISAGRLRVEVAPRRYVRAVTISGATATTTLFGYSRKGK